MKLYGIMAAGLVGLGLVTQVQAGHHGYPRGGVAYYQQVTVGPIGVATFNARYLGGHDFYCDHGRSDAGFIVGLYQTVLGRTPQPCEVHQWLHQLAACGCRVTLSQQFLVAAQPELAQRAAAAACAAHGHGLPAVGIGGFPVAPQVDPRFGVQPQIDPRFGLQPQIAPPSYVPQVPNPELAPVPTPVPGVGFNGYPRPRTGVSLQVQYRR